MEIEFMERGNGYPDTGDVLVCHDDETAYRVLPGAGHIETHGMGRPNTCLLNVEVVEYEDHWDDPDSWEI